MARIQPNRFNVQRIELSFTQRETIPWIRAGVKVSAFCNLMAVGIKNVNVLILSTRVSNAAATHQSWAGCGDWAAKYKLANVSNVSGIVVTIPQNFRPESISRMAVVSTV